MVLNIQKIYSLISIQKKVFIFLLLLSALHILNRFLAVFIYGKILFHHRFYYILLLPLLSKLILKENLHKHHYLSLTISIIGWILLNIPICLKIQMNDLLANFINLINAAIYLLFIVLIK